MYSYLAVRGEPSPMLEATHEPDTWFCDPRSPPATSQSKISTDRRAGVPLRVPSSGAELTNAVASFINNQRRRSLCYQGPTSLYDDLIVQ